MISFNTDAYGQVMYVNLGEDISSATAFTLVMEPKSGDKVEVTPTLGTSDQVVGDETFSANQYVKYTTTSDVFSDYTGIWRAKATATVGSTIVSSDYRLFRVTD